MKSFDIDKYNYRECQVHNHGFYLGEQSKQAEVDELRKRLTMYEREGYKLVPVEPNQKQIDAGIYAVDLVSNDSIQVVNVYKAMIGANE